MNKRIMAIILIIGLMLPQKAKAELDFLVDLVKGFENIEGQVTKVVEEYTGYQIKLQEKTTSNKNLKAVKKLMQSAKKAEKGKWSEALLGMLDMGDFSEFFNTKISNLQWPGLNAAMDMACGEYTTPQNKQMVLLAYFKKSHVKDDLKVTKEKDEAIDNLTRENLAIDYANATVAVLELQEEAERLSKPDEEKDNKELKNDGEDLRVLENNYGIVMRRANHRWQDFVMFEASHISNVLKISANNVSIDEFSESMGADAKEVVSDMTEKTKDSESKFEEKGSNGMVVDGVLAAATTGVKAIQSNNYSGAFNSLTGMYANTPGHSDKIAETLSDVSSIISTGDSARRSVENGKPEDAVQDFYNTVMEEEKKKEEERKKKEEEENKQKNTEEKPK